jgi:Ni/Co efflux regulator RcnB
MEVTEMKRLILAALMSMCLFGISHGQKEGGDRWERPEKPYREKPERRDCDRDRDRDRDRERDRDRGREREGTCHGKEGREKDGSTKDSGRHVY